MTINVTPSDIICRLLIYTHKWQLHMSSIAIQSAHTRGLFCRKNILCLHHQRGLWCMTCLTRLINDVSKAHTTSLGKGCGHGECKQGEEWEWALNLRAERRSSRWYRWQVRSSLGITLHLWYSDCTICDISALISATHHTTREVPWTWITFEINRDNITEQTANVCAVGRLKIIWFKASKKKGLRNIKSDCLIKSKGLKIWFCKINAASFIQINFKFK